MKRALLYRRGGLGDTLLTLPVAEVLSREGYKVCFLANSDYIPLITETEWVDEAYSAEYLSYFIDRPFDQKIVISKGGTLDPFPKERIWLPHYYLASLGLPLNFSQRLPSQQKTFWGGRTKGLAVIHPGSGSPKKNPPFSLFLKIEHFLKRKGYEVLYVGGEAEAWLKGHAVNTLFTRDISELRDILSEASLYVGNDSGVSHLASYMGLKTFVFFGPSDEIVFRPIGMNVHIISLNLTCRPCFPKTCSERMCLNEDALMSLFVQEFLKYY